MSVITYYITAHGYGHGTRSCDILNALHQAAPDVRLIAKTDLPADFTRSRLAPAIEVRPEAFDVGLIQKDAIHVDLPASLEALQHLVARQDALIAQEEAFLSESGTQVVVSDLPAIPLAAAQRMGIENLAVGNFGWDWIYQEFAEQDPRWRPIIADLQNVYAKTDLLLRLPFAEPMAAFPRQIDLPLLAKPGTARRGQIARATGADPNKPWVLISFYSLELDPGALQHLDELDEVECFTVEPLSWPQSRVHTISRDQFAFADTLASCDIVVSKPGFGIISECVANQKPLIYTDRAHFKEYPVLVECIKKYCRHAFIPNQTLYAGKLKRALDEARVAGEPTQQIAAGGAERAAELILERMQGY